MSKKQLFSFLLYPLFLAAQPETVTLELTPIHHLGGLGLGIDVSVGGGPFNLCLFDTGSSGLYVAPQIVGSGASDTGNCFQYAYLSGNSFCGYVYEGVIDLGSGVATSSSGIFGNIYCAQNSMNDSFDKCHCNYGPCSGMPPLCNTTPDTHCFPINPDFDSPSLYGTCGVSLMPGSSITDNLYTVIAQMPGNLSSGFIIQTGGYPNAAPRLTVGLTPENSQGFLFVELEQDGSYPNNLPAWYDKGTLIHLNLNDQGVEQSFEEGLRSVFDTGTPDVIIYQNSSAPELDCAFANNCTQNYLNSGVAFNVIGGDGNEGLNWTFKTGQNRSQNLVGINNSSTTTKTYLNTGINVFFTYDVMYDMANGRLGFRPIQSYNVSGKKRISSILEDIDGIPTSVVQNGPGEVTLTARNSYSGGTILSGGTLSVLSDVNLGASYGGVIFNGGTLKLKGNFASTRNFAVFSTGGSFNTGPYSATLFGTLNGKGLLEKTGSGSLIFSGNQNAPTPLFSGAIVVSQGSLVANGNLSGSTIQVNAQGTLQGSGTVGSVTNGGIVAPGNSIGTLNLTGSYTQTPKGDLNLMIAPDGRNSLLAIDGSASLSGSLTITPLPGVYEKGTTYIFLDADGGVTGTFQEVNSPLLQMGDPIYSSDTVSIRVASNGAVFAGVPHGYNAKKVYKYLTDQVSYPFSSDLVTVLSALTKLRDPTKALNTLDPALFGAFTLINASTNHLALVSLLDRSEKVFCRPSCPRNWTVWEAPFGFLTWQHQIGEQPGFNAHVGGFLAGVDYTFDDHLSIGFSGGFDKGRLHWHEGLGLANIENGLIALYAALTEDAYYADFALLGGWKRYTAWRNMNFLFIDRSAKHKSNAYDLTFHLDAGALLPLKGYCINIQPYASLDYFYLYTQGFEEKGAESLNLSVQPYHSNLLRTAAGIKSTWTWGALVPGVWVEAINEAFLTNRQFFSRMQHQKEYFHVRTFNEPIFLFSPGCDLNYSWQDLTVTLRYSAELNHQINTQNGDLRLEYSF